MNFGRVLYHKQMHLKQNVFCYILHHMQNKTKPKTLATPLRTLRLKRGLTLERVAKGIGWDTGNLSRVERGQPTSLERAEKLVKFYRTGITEMEILYPSRYAK